MNESSFDIQIKRILADAEESVSPAVWEGVAAGLDRRKRVVPLWVWRAAAGIAVAASLAAGVFLFSPRPEVLPDLPEQIQQSPLLSQSMEEPSLPAPVKEQQERWVPQAAPKVTPDPAPKPAAAEQPVTEEPLAEEPQDVAPSTEAETEIEAEQAAPDETEQWRRILAEEPAPKERRPLEWTVSGDLQDRFRRNTTSRALSRRVSTRPTPTETGVTWENPEYSFSIPFTAGVGVRIPLNERWSIGTGVQYTNMRRSFIGDYVEVDDDGVVDFGLTQTDIQNMQHWVGVPLNVYFDILPKGRWNVHAFAGGAVEYLVNNHYLVHTDGNDIRLDKRGKGVQPSIGAGVGVELRLAPNFGLFFDPSIRYYFDTKQPRSIRTIQPLRMDLEAGVRFTL